jgi:hypothetical protein
VKKQLTIRLDADVLSWLKAQGRVYQTCASLMGQRQPKTGAGPPAPATEACQLQRTRAVLDNSTCKAPSQLHRFHMIDCTHCKTPNPDFAESCSQCSEPLPISDSATIQMVDPTVPSPGSDFGPRYSIECLLGQGGMGRVYKAKDKELDRIVAIKVVRQGAMGEGDALNRFKQELVLASKISHKNILRIHDLGDLRGMKFITMAFVDG